MKLLCDQMLGTLAKWLRILGFDTYYANSKISDKELLDIAKKENRIIISRDKGFVNSARKQNVESIEIADTDLDEQLKQVLKHVTINKKLILSRCTICNSKIKNIKKGEVKGKVPKRVYENNDSFWYCSTCKKYYWTGSHYDKITEKIKELINN